MPTECDLLIPQGIPSNLTKSHRGANPTLIVLLWRLSVDYHLWAYKPGYNL